MKSVKAKELQSMCLCFSGLLFRQQNGGSPSATKSFKGTDWLTDKEGELTGHLRHQGTAMIVEVHLIAGNFFDCLVDDLVEHPDE